VSKTSKATSSLKNTTPKSGKREASAGVPKGWSDVPLSSLVKASWNYKTDNQKMHEKLKTNLKRNGQIINLIIRELPTGFYEVVNGNHRYDVLVELKKESAHCFNLGPVNEETAIRLAVETNETNFDSDTVKLGSLLGQLSTTFDMDDLISTMPYSQPEFEGLIKMSEFSWDNFGQSNDDDKKEQNLQKDGDEKWVDLTLKLPESVNLQFEQQLDRLRDIISQQQGRACKNMVQVIELLCVFLANNDDETIVKNSYDS